jgi:hypothetical protein
MEVNTAKVVVKANLENLKKWDLNRLTRLCERKCIGQFDNLEINQVEATCLDVCVKKYFVFQEIPKKVYQDDTIKRNAIIMK